MIARMDVVDSQRAAVGILIQVFQLYRAREANQPLDLTQLGEALRALLPEEQVYDVNDYWMDIVTALVQMTCELGIAIEADYNGADILQLLRRLALTVAENEAES